MQRTQLMQRKDNDWNDWKRLNNDSFEWETKFLTFFLKNIYIATREMRRSSCFSRYMVIVFAPPIVYEMLST